MRSIALFVIRYLLIACAVAGCVYALLLARAQWLMDQDTAASVPSAVQLVPYNSAYVARLAAWQAAHRIELLHRAVALDDFNYESWTQLGFAAEFQQHDLPGAERYYLKAAEVNHMFLPKWTLTNFYFRQGRETEFFRWANAALDITPYSPEPIFTQMWLMSQEPAKIDRFVPTRPPILLQYAWFLSNNRQNALVAPVVKRLIAAAGSKDPRAWGRDDLLAVIQDRLVAAGEVNSALVLWDNQVSAGWLRETIPTVVHPVTNGDFHIPLFRHGFDWIPEDPKGTTLEQLTSDGSLQIRLSGAQPERCTLLHQYLPLEPGRNYWLHWKAKSQNLENPSGLTWHIRSVGQNSPAEIESGDLLASQADGWNFQASPGAQIALLTLDYARPLGNVKANGNLTLRSVDAGLK